jgi:hypothetical protein
MSHGADEFRWNLTDNGKFSVGSMYRTFIHPLEPVVNIKKFWKMKIPMKTKVFTWYLYRRVILKKITLQSGVGREV